MSLFARVKYLLNAVSVAYPPRLISSVRQAAIGVFVSGSLLVGFERLISCLPKQVMVNLFALSSNTAALTPINFRAEATNHNQARRIKLAPII